MGSESIRRVGLGSCVCLWNTDRGRKEEVEKKEKMIVDDGADVVSAEQVEAAEQKKNMGTEEYQKKNFEGAA